MSDEIKDTAALPSKDFPTADEITSSEAGKGKGKGKAVEEETDEDDEDEDDEMNNDDDDDDEVEEDFSEIDPTAILASSRRSTRTTVDYASAEAQAKAGLNGDLEEEDEGIDGEGDKTFESAGMATDDE